MTNSKSHFYRTFSVMYLMEIFSKSPLFKDLKNTTTSFRKKIAFTLAEVLITLGIIGVVAAMTLPTLSTKIAEVRTMAEVKRNVETFSQAYKMLINDFGDVGALVDTSKTDYENASTFFDAMAHYLKVSKKCGLNEKTCFPTSIKTLDGRTLYTWYGHSNICMGILVTGVSFWVLNVQGSTQILFDINGGDKKPNQLGVDQFWFSVNQANGSMNYGDPSANCDKKSKTSNYNGYSCTGRIIKEGNMNYYYKD